MSQHCPACFGTTPGDDPKPCPGCGHEAQLDALAIREGHQDIGPCDGCSCPFCLLRAEIATLRGLIMARDSNLKLLEKAELELAALQAERDGFALSAQRTATDLHDAGKRIMELEAALALAENAFVRLSPTLANDPRLSTLEEKIATVEAEYGELVQEHADLEAALAAAKAALAVADEMADEILVEQSPGSILGKIAARFHAARKVEK